MVFVPLLLAVLLAAPAQGAVTNLIPANVVDDSPTDVFTSDMGIEAIGTATVRGADICIVSQMTSDPGDGSLSCDGRAWGSTNPLIGLGTFFLPLEPPTLRLGTYRLLADGGADGEEPDKLSEPFKVVSCDSCDPAPALSIFADWKSSAGTTADSGELACALYNTGGSKKKLATQAVQNIQNGAPFAIVAVSAVGGFAFANLIDAAPQAAMLDKWLGVLRAVTCRAAEMYRAIANDPPDPNYQSIAQPLFGYIPSLPDDDAGSLLFGLDALHAAGMAELTAVERFQGAMADGDDEWMSKQASAAADAGLRVAATMRTMGARLEAFASRLEAHGIGGEPLTQGESDAAEAFAERVRDSGFTAEEEAAISAGVGAAHTSDLRDQIGSERFPQAAVGKTPLGATRSFADALLDEADDHERFAHAMLEVAPRQAPAALTAVITSPTPATYFNLAPFNGRFSAEASRPGASPLTGYHWDFGDGATDEGLVTTHRFEAPGTYTVTLSISAANGTTATATREVQVKSRSSLLLPNCHDPDTGDQQFNCPGYDELAPGGALTVVGSGPKQLIVDHTDQNGVFSNAIFWLKVDDEHGHIGGVAPGEPEWMALALARARELFPQADPVPNKVTLDVDGGDHVAFGLTSGLSLADAAHFNPINAPAVGGDFMFPFDAANGVQVTQILPYRRQSDGAVQLGFEDLPSGGDNFIDEVLMISGASVRVAAELGVAVKADSDRVTTGGATGYAVKVRSGGGDAILDSITNTLPAGFSYVPGSTRGATTGDPQIDGRKLTWSGRFTIPAGGAAGLRFSVRAADVPGTYLDEATADARGFPITPSGPTAPVTVVAPVPAEPPAGAAPGPGPPAPAAAPRPSSPARFVAREVVRLPKSCTSRRRFTIRVVQPRGVKLVSATVRVNGRVVRAVKGARLTAPINLSGLPKGRFTIKITAVAKDGRKVTSTRRYRTCAKRR